VVSVLALGVAAAAAVPPATTWIEYSGLYVGPLPVGLSGSGDTSDVIYWPRFPGDSSFPFEAQSVASASTSLNVFSRGVDVAVEASDDGYTSFQVGGGNSAGAEGGVSFFFAVVPIKSAPWDPPQLPFYFEAMGEGSATSSAILGAGFEASALLLVPTFPVGFFTAHDHSMGTGTVTGGFDYAVTLWLDPNDEANPYYEGRLYASCYASSHSSIELGYDADGHTLLLARHPDSGEAWAVVDPELSLDQAAFDAQYGTASFRLDEYYSLEFSENLVIPHPGDANNDGFVNVGDLGILALNWNSSGKTWATGDFTGEGTVNVGDLGVLALNWGWVGTPGGAGSVPEPATLSLLTLGGLAMLRRRH
jgi:hypothetical protein